LKEDLAREFIGLMITLDRATRKHYNVFRAEANFTDKQFRTMMFLHKNGKVKLKEMSKRINLSNSSLCIMLNKMVEDGYAARELDEKDRRNMYYFLTEVGEETFSKEFAMRMNIMNGVFETRLTEEEKHKFLESIYNMKSVFEKLNALEN